jgi:phosphoesterase RecJ-like protein
MIWNDLLKTIAKNDNFLICAHESPDGDSIGSQLAFYKYLKNIGKNAAIYNKDKPPQKFRFLPNCEVIRDVLGNEKFDVLTLMDCSNLQRPAIENINKFAPKIVNIDHHRDNMEFGDVNCVDVKSAATCRIIYEFFVENNIKIDADMANCLFAGILTDTSGFQFNNDDGSLYLVANDLVKRGANNAFLFKKLFAQNSLAALKIRAKIWETLEFYAHDKISVISMPKNLLSEYGEDSSATEGMSNLAMNCENVEVGVFVKYDDKEVRISLRSAGNVDVGEIAEQCEIGGGHKFAAGCTIKNVSVKEAIRIIVDKISQ